MPGGVGALLKTAGLDESLPRTRALREVVHVIYDAAEGTSAASDTRRRDVLAYLESVAGVEALVPAAQQAAPSIRQAEDKTIRRRLEAIADALGCTLERDSRTYRLEPGRGERQARRRANLSLAGLDLDSVLASANAGQPIAVSLRSEDVPLPLSPDTWTSVTRPSDRPQGSLISTILGDRQAAFLYYGLLGTDAATRDFFERNPAVLKGVVESDRAAVFAAYGQSLRVAGGRVAVPGGRAAEPLWEALAGESVARPDQFVLDLLHKDDGRLASLFDAVSALDPPHQAFVLGFWTGDPDARVERFRRLYEAYGRLLLAWDPAARPFVRSLFDGGHVLAMTPVNAAGRPSGPTLARLWSRAFDGSGLPANPAKELGDAERDGDADAAWLLQVLADSGHSFTLRRNRAEEWLFGQRAFRDASRSSLPDQFLTLRAFPRFKVLLLTLERIGVRDPKLYAAAVVQVDRLSRIGDRDRAATALALFQGALSIVERARAARTLDAPAAEALVRSLVAVPIADDGEYFGGIGRWMTTAMVPAFVDRLAPPVVAGTPSVEDVVLQAMAGRALSMADSPNLGLSLDGLSYTVDLAGAELARMRTVRDRQRGVPLDAGLNLGQAAAVLRAPGVSLAQLPVLAAELDSAAQAVLGIQGPAVTWLDQDWFRKLAASARNDVRAIRKPKDLQKLERMALPFLGVADRLQAQATMSLAYAAVVRDPQSTALLDGDPAARHDWALGESAGEWGEPPSWSEPAEDREGGWHLKGSLLGADLALARESLRRVSLDRFPSPPTLSDSDAQTIAETVALMVAFDQSDADRESLVSALGRGRRQLEAVLRSPASWPAAADAMQLRDFRRELLPWTMAYEPTAVETLLSLGELLLLGQLPGAPAAQADAWGTSGRAYDGRWSLRYPVPVMFNLLSGRKGGSLTVGLVPDLVLSVAEAMHERQVPAVLTRSVLECAARDLIDEVQLQYFDDWLTLVGQSRVLSDRLDEYLASLTSGGPLVPVVR